MGWLHRLPYHPTRSLPTNLMLMVLISWGGAEVYSSTSYSNTTHLCRSSVNFNVPVFPIVIRLICDSSLSSLSLFIAVRWGSGSWSLPSPHGSVLLPNSRHELLRRGQGRCPDGRTSLSPLIRAFHFPLLSRITPLYPEVACIYCPQRHHKWLQRSTAKNSPK